MEALLPGVPSCWPAFIAAGDAPLAASAEPPFWGVPAALRSPVWEADRMTGDGAALPRDPPTWMVIFFVPDCGAGL